MRKRITALAAAAAIAGTVTACGGTAAQHAASPLSATKANVAFCREDPEDQVGAFTFRGDIPVRKLSAALRRDVVVARFWYSSEFYVPSEAEARLALRSQGVAGDCKVILAEAK